MRHFVSLVEDKTLGNLLVKLERPRGFSDNEVYLLEPFDLDDSSRPGREIFYFDTILYPDCPEDSNCTCWYEELHKLKRFYYLSRRHFDANRQLIARENIYRTKCPYFYTFDTTGEPNKLCYIKPNYELSNSEYEDRQSDKINYKNYLEENRTRKFKTEEKEYQHKLENKRKAHALNALLSSTSL